MPQGNINQLANSLSDIPNSKFVKEFSIITLVNNIVMYNEMLKTFSTSGFVESNSEFIYIDNTEHNHNEAYSSLNQAIIASKGRYIILCHQDVRIIFDSIRDLKQRISEINKVDPDWAVLGNAGGGFNLTEIYLRITDPSGYNMHIGKLPSKVASLDENFLVLNSNCNPYFSKDLRGFHFYGTDICQQAYYKGLNCYVINFHIQHLSSGNKDAAYYNAKKTFIKSYKTKLKPRFIRTTTCRLYISASVIKNFIFNSLLIQKIIRTFNLNKSRK